MHSSKAAISRASPRHWYKTTSTVIAACGLHSQQVHACSVMRPWREGTLGFSTKRSTLEASSVTTTPYLEGSSTCCDQDGALRACLLVECQHLLERELTDHVAACGTGSFRSLKPVVPPPE